MKHLKRYKKYNESESNIDTKIEDIKDIFLELSDMGYSVEVKQKKDVIEHSSLGSGFSELVEDIKIIIQRSDSYHRIRVDGRRQREKVDVFGNDWKKSMEDMKDTIERVIRYLDKEWEISFWNLPARCIMGVAPIYRLGDHKYFSVEITFRKVK